MSGQNKIVKKELADELAKQFSSIQAAVLTQCSGVTVEKMTELRASLRSKNAQFKVIKNTIAERAVHGTGLEVLKDHFKGPTALAFTESDPVDLAKMLVEFAQKNDKFSIKAGVLDGSLLDAAQVKSLASTPSREVLLARLAGSMQSPYASLVYGLSGILRKFVYALEAVRRQKEQKGS